MDHAMMLNKDKPSVRINPEAMPYGLVEGVDCAAVAKRGIETVHPLVKETLCSGLTSRGLLHLRVGLQLESPEYKSPSFLQLAELDYGPRSSWHRAYDEISLQKALLTVRTGMDTRAVQLHHTYLKCEGDTDFYGSVILPVELPSGKMLFVVVAASGVQPWFDEMFAGWTAQATAALLIGEYAKLEPAA